MKHNSITPHAGSGIRVLDLNTGQVITAGVVWRFPATPYQSEHSRFWRPSELNKDGRPDGRCSGTFLVTPEDPPMSYVQHVRFVMLPEDEKAREAVLLAAGRTLEAIVQTNLEVARLRRELVGLFTSVAPVE